MAKLLALLTVLGLHAVANAGEARFHWYRYDGRNGGGLTLEAGEFRNPIISGHAPDPSITRVGSDYYLVTSSFAHFPGLPIYHSTDLVSWRQIGNAIDRPEQMSFDGMAVSEGIMAPDISYKNGLFYIVSTSRDNFVITARDPTGPWSRPVWLPFDGIDPSIFWDDDGRAYIVNNGPPEGHPLYEGHRTLWIQEFDAINLKMIGLRKPLVGAGAHPPHIFWAEGPHIFKKAGFYYLIAAAGGTRPGERHTEIVFRSHDLMGPYEIYPNNPILDQNDLPADRPDAVESVGHAKFVLTQTGEWWTVFLGARPYAPGFYNIGRETFLLPVSWVNDWPVVLKKGQPMPLKARRPGLPAAARPSRPQSGDFGYLDDFDGGSLPLGWIGIRVPKQPTYRVGRGELVIDAHAAAIGDQTQSPSFVGRRQAHPIATISTAVGYSPSEEGARAGLLAVQSDDNYLFVGIQRLKGDRHVVLSARQGADHPTQGVTLASLPLPAQFEQAVQLRLSLDRGRASVDYALEQDQWQRIKNDLDVTFLSTKKAGGFVGTVIGLYSERGMRTSSSVVEDAQ